MHYDPAYSVNLTDNCANGNTFLPLLNVASNIAELQTLGNLSTSSYGVSLYQGQLCYSVNGTATIMVNGTLFGMSGYLPGRVDFNACLDAKYNLPLRLFGTLSVPHVGSANFYFTQLAFHYNSYAGNIG